MILVEHDKPRLVRLEVTFLNCILAGEGSLRQMLCSMC